MGKRKDAKQVARKKATRKKRASPSGVRPRAGKSAAKTLDAERAARALEKRRRGKRPTAEELASLKRVEADRQEKHRWGVYGAIRKKDWREMSGRPDHVLNKQADLYGIPLRGATFDLAGVAKWIHDFLAEHSVVLQAARTGDDLDTRRKAARLGLEELRLDRERAELVPASAVENAHHDWLRWTLGVFDAAIAGLPAKLAGKTVHQQRQIVRAYFRARVEEVEKRRPK